MSRAQRWGMAVAVLAATMVTPVCVGQAKAASGTTGLHVIPFPGTPDASPSTEIIFSSLERSELRSVSVVGSLTGGHDGRLIQLPDRAGAAFVPARPFTARELVWVSAELSSPAAGTASGDPGATRLSFSFRVAPPTPAGGGTPTSSFAVNPTQHFRSRPYLRPPAVSVRLHGHPDSGDIFLTPANSSQVGPMILDSRGKLVWFRPVSRGEATNLQAQRYQGHRVLTWWQGVWSVSAEDVVVDRSYRTEAVLHAANGYVADLHEFKITPRGTALITAWTRTHADLRSVGGSSNGLVWDCIIQELDIKTGHLLWEWHSLGHVPLSDSHSGRPDPFAPYDFFHLNSIQELPNGNLLISARSTWAIYEVSRSTGKVLWALGGKRSSFKMEPGTRFEWQHDARLHGANLTLFDDAAVPPEERKSSALRLRVDMTSMTVSLLHRYPHSPPLLAGAGGSAQILPDHNLFVGWGSQPAFSEYSPGGRQIFDASLPIGVDSYRAFRFPWRGQPITRPSLAVKAQGNGRLRAYASWNGATDVAAWRILGGARWGNLTPLGAVVPRRGFETMIRLRSGPRYLKVQALNRNGKVLGTSAAEAANGVARRSRITRGDRRR